MSGKVGNSLTLATALGRRLDALANEKSRRFWESYLKGAVPFRGVPMAGIRKAVHEWWKFDGPSTLPLPVQKKLALTLFEGTYCEDKLAGTLTFQEILLQEVTLDDVIEFGALFDRELISDWNTCDWFCIKVLAPLIARDLPSRVMADEIASWKSARTLWQRRAANVAFVPLAKSSAEPFKGFFELMLETSKVTVLSRERFAQTGVAWLLREMSVNDRDEVLFFVRKRLSLMSREAIHSVGEKMPTSERRRLLEEHKKAQPAAKDGATL